MDTREILAATKNSFSTLISEQEWDFPPSQRSPLPGSPAFPDHLPRRRAAYGAVSVLVGVTGGLGNAIVSSNLPYLQGALGLDQTEMAWLPVVYAVANACSGGMLFKYRLHFGVRSFALIFVALHLVLILMHLFVEDFTSAILVRGASGCAAAGLSTLSLYYMMQAFPPKLRLSAIILGISAPLLSIPLSRLFPAELLALNEWRGFYLMEFGLSALSLAAVLVVRLPPSSKGSTFEPLDFVTMVFYIGAVACFGSVVGLGYYYWWDRHWIGWCLAAFFMFAAIVFAIERNRVKPLVDVKWLSGLGFVRFAIVMVVVRVILAEQATGVVGFLRLFGYRNDDYFWLSALIFVSSLAGPIVAALCIKPDRTLHFVAFSIALVAFAAIMDSYSSDLTRPAQFYFSQALIAFSTTMFVGPAVIFGVSRVMAEGPHRLASFVVLFGITQSIGTLIGTAVIQSYQFYAEREFSAVLIPYATALNPVVQAQLSTVAARYKAVIVDPAGRLTQAAAQLSATTTLQSNVLAYNATFRFVAALAALTAVFLALIIIFRGLRTRMHRSSM